VIELTRSLAALRATDEPDFGGKSASLGELIASGINVPPGFAVSTSAFDSFFFAEGLRDRVTRHLETVDLSDVGTVAAAAAKIADEMRGTPLPQAVHAEIEREYLALGALTDTCRPPVAVRSSARGEDSADATFAGQQETYLWVIGAEAVSEAVRDCWISLYSAPALSYRARIGAAIDSSAMGVAVQFMVDAEVAGVMFTCSPLTGDPSIVAVNASWGLGLGVVGGEVTPDHFVLSKVSGELLRQTINDKSVEYVPEANGGGTRRVDVPADRQLEASLDPERLAALLDLAKRVERHFATRQDIEWAIARSSTFPGSLFVLQSRPVTTVAQPVARPAAQGGTMSRLLETFGVGKDEIGSDHE